MPSKPMYEDTSERSTQVLSATLPVIELAIKTIEEKRMLDGVKLKINYRYVVHECLYVIWLMEFWMQNSVESSDFPKKIDYCSAESAGYKEQMCECRIKTNEYILKFLQNYA